MRPVVSGCFGLEQLHLTNINLEDVARANDALDVLEENERRAAERARG